MTLMDYLLNKIIAPIIVGVAIPTILGIGSQLNNGNWSIWLEQVPLYIWVFFLVLIIIWISIILVRRRYKETDDLDAGYGSIGF